MPPFLAQHGSVLRASKLLSRELTNQEALAALLAVRAVELASC
jgi:hypothetical protein